MKHIIVEQDNELYESDEFFAYVKRGDTANMLGDVSMDDAYHIVCTVTRWLVEGLPDYRKQTLDKLLQKIANEMFLLPHEGQKENVYDILNWLVKIGELRLAHGVYDVPPCERVYIK